MHKMSKEHVYLVFWNNVKVGWLLLGGHNSITISFSTKLIPKLGLVLIWGSHFSRVIKNLFTTCLSDNYLFHENSVLKYVFQKPPGD